MAKSRAQQAAIAIAKKSKKLNEKDPCWDGYRQAGMKKGRKGNMVPNCVPEEKSFKDFREAYRKPTNEVRQMKDPKKDAMVVKNKKVIVIDKGKEKEYLKKGWQLAEEDLDEVSTGTLKRYSAKATGDAVKAKQAADKGDPEAASRQDKRVRGVNRATAILKKRQQNEATYKGKKVPLNKPMTGDVKKSKVYVDPDGDGKAKKVNFGQKGVSIKKHIPGKRANFRARHNCDNPGPKDKARYWSCKAW